ncbi:MAG: hypothetical protein COZ37_05310 [bacterium (Candidatus Ratteibacteria) CG_4_10_14_3_um_filter_41_18]|uniref:YgiT-type zinc finger domain-containing protein n=4 Tax=Candidatus Ratteibacteria TaxID=2979319 RepID=A0A2M7E6T3_9BACT|nr:MAG: hypothetical protein COS11_07360 [bacterium (Candidatus Ratteibacteria) CG01_land_8_20_14_3_00_40_19]PIW33261.1 MAG: hypothetical protein COW28_04300 [bacterium (Candidatus Ratteibacteria) CG15_BIG_FIL_POST_REV_8_21_14_020_41_12]PIW74316.1 MAG: hypothetical protein CO004_01360 [bacterium (Candidatus Ratteibacteria) CG_4_8_14_3_um_filter_41_36]PIX76937.1 MAG: hypothetical protein COZ37_05310 [bacterium (Candidatus Ratteibacteria) CG_4_10_14_3_um_filter_41_18]PJA61887.1 MAG: hypothetical 
MSKKKRCAICGGVKKKSIQTVDRHWGDKLLIFEDVPVEVCTECGEVWLCPETVETMEKVVKSGRAPEKTIPIPVWSMKKHLQPV